MDRGLVIYYLCVNLLAFACFGIDKHRARNQYWRIPEKVLLALAFLGGGAGALAGMRVFRHKTRKTAFRIGVPAALILHGCILFWYVKMNLDL